MSCKDCKYSPKTYEEYCIGQSNPNMYCRDAYAEKSYLCDESEVKLDKETQRWLEKKMREAIKVLEQEPFINKDCVSKGVCNEDKIKVLDKIRNEVKALTDGAEPEHVWNVDVLAIIDKYKAESEE